MKMKSITLKKHFIVLAVMLATSLTAWADNVVSGDYVKDNVKYFRWYFHKDVGVLELAKPDGFTGEIPYIVYDKTPFYSYWAQIKKVFVRDGITKIPKSMFSLNDYGSTHYTNLEELDCSDAAATLTTIDEQAFKYCAGLKTVRLPYGVTIGVSAFEDCTSLTTVILSGDKTTETTIGATAFKGCTSLESVSFDSGKTVKIETSAFTNCTGLKTVYTGGANVTVGASAFSGSGLETFCNSSSIPYVTNLKMEDGAFGGASKLKGIAISIGSNDITIPYHAFQNCTSLEDFATWGGGKVTVGNGAFEGCTSLESIYCTSSYNNITSVGSNEFSGCTSLESFTASADLTSIGTSAFKNCTGMKYVDLRNANAETLKLGDLRTDGTIYRSDSWCATTSVNAFIYAPSNLPASKAHGDNIVTTGTGDDAGKLFCNGPCFYENSPVGFPSDGKFYSTNTVAYWRTFTAGQYYTICLPYAMKNAKLKYYTLKKVDGNTIEFDEVEHSNVEANKPYVVYAKETLETLTIGSSTSRIEVGGTADHISKDDYGLWGNFGKTIDAAYLANNYTSSNIYILQSDGKWKLFDGSNDDVKIPPFRAFITVKKNAGAPAMLASDFGGGTTGIGDLTPALSEGEGVWYDLQGRRIEGRPTQKGVYIVGGKKIIVK